MSTLPSIRQRLARSVRWISLLTGLAVAAAVWAVLTHEVHELLDETLQASAQVLAGLLPSQLDAPAWASPPDAGRDFAWQLVGPGGDVRMRASRAPELLWMPLPTEGLASAGSGWRVYGLRHGEAMLYVAQTHEERLETQAGMALAAAAAAFVVGALGALMLGRRVAAELRPLDETVRALQVFEPLQPDRPLPAAGRAEIGRAHV